jgi:spermidine/putrescine transport system permease protein
MAERARATGASGVREARFPPPIILPAIGWFLWFLVIPLSIVIAYSFCAKGPYGGVLFRLTRANYLRAMDPVYLRVLWNSLKLAAFTTLSCLLLGYPMAYVIATSARRFRSVLLMLVVLPFWTNFVVRAYAIKVLLSAWGPVSQVALALGFVNAPLDLGNGDLAVWLGMVTNYLPFMVLPLYVSMEKLDFSLLEAARDLGASPFRTLWNVLIPLTRHGIVTGVILVFTPALGEFVIPDLLGGARTMLIGNLITEQFLKTRDWPFGAALSFLLIGVVLVSLRFYLRVGEEQEQAAPAGVVAESMATPERRADNG